MGPLLTPLPCVDSPIKGTVFPSVHVKLPLKSDRSAPCAGSAQNVTVFPLRMQSHRKAGLIFRYGFMSGIALKRDCFQLQSYVQTHPKMGLFFPLGSNV